MKNAFGEFLVGAVYLGALLLLVRPGSQGPTLVTNVSNGLTGILKAGTGGGSWSG